MDTSVIKGFLTDLSILVMQWLTSLPFYVQLGIVLLAVVAAYGLSQPLKRLPEGESRAQVFAKRLYLLRDMTIPLVYVLILGVAMRISDMVVEQDALVRLVQGVAIVLLCHAMIRRVVLHNLLKSFFVWSMPPIVMLYVIGWLAPTVAYLDRLHINLGHIEFSVYGVMRTVFFGMVLFWSGRAINRIGQQVIRQRADLDIGTKEVFVKLFEVLLIITIFFVLLQIIGINLTTLAVFGGAVGVGLGFGLQAIASNFISGIILLLDRSLLVGDYIELEDGRKGIIRQLSMRCATLETFDGKDIVVPNEKFITSSFTNWTHKDIKQRYSLEFQVAYKTDLHALFPLLRETVANHPQVISGEGVPIEEQPDAEISGFGDSGVNILIEYWMEGVDDGKNRVGADLLLMIWDTLKEHVIDIPYPQRDIRILDGKGK
jgi:small-conductance mechanosensitive channel